MRGCRAHRGGGDEADGFRAARTGLREPAGKDQVITVWQKRKDIHYSRQSRRDLRASAPRSYDRVQRDVNRVA
ncbi:hypothetical protein BN6_45230 [Saccharothrix espanaensis DSM 44229]|uniref:Uncharacterized protein n=1 Tax=Saccharothrix espanaensis (strain ATCC 51144 / DSM 44229 / JCM 9112 / NBRC 15066 / NRRL 15764) TaxID=1179773 RepID=K0K5H0_SACES|nr:hypothetical protein BN6_45230 [Saccharothrix espanaensis DSM 44229]